MYLPNSLTPQARSRYRPPNKTDTVLTSKPNRLRSTKVAVTNVHGNLYDSPGTIPIKGDTRPKKRNKEKLWAGKVKTLRVVRPMIRIRSDRVNVGIFIRAIAATLIEADGNESDNVDTWASRLGVGEARDQTRHFIGHLSSHHHFRRFYIHIHTTIVQLFQTLETINT